MYIHQSALHNLVPGEPTPDAIHREEYFTTNREEAEPEATIIDHKAGRLASLLRAQVTMRVGSFFA